MLNGFKYLKVRKFTARKVIVATEISCLSFCDNLPSDLSRDLFGSKIPMTTASNCAKETLLWSLEFVIKINIERETIALWNLAQSCEVTRHLISSIFNFLKNFFFSYFFLKSATAALICTFHLPYLFVYIFFFDLW